VKEFALGIDIGGTSTKFALVDRAGRIAARHSFPTTEQPDEHAFLDTLLGVVGVLSDSYALAGIGAGAPSVNEQNGTIEYAANLPFRKAFPFVDLVSERTGLPVFLVKDSNASTLGEMRYGTAEGMRHFVLLTLGTGLGCGVVSDGKLLQGARGHAGEAGHICVERGGRACGCGRSGCLETYVSATGLKRTVFEMLGQSLAASSLRSISYERMTSRDIFDAAAAGDAIATLAFERTGDILGRALADMAAWFEPEVFILSGGLASAGERLFTPTIRSLERHALAFHRGKLSVLPSSLGENDAALLGAAALVWSGGLSLPASIPSKQPSP
jgi:glucokinase